MGEIGQLAEASAAPQHAASQNYKEKNLDEVGFANQKIVVHTRHSLEYMWHSHPMCARSPARDLASCSPAATLSTHFLGAAYRLDPLTSTR